MKASILGCGWLGFPLAERLVQEGWMVQGSTTTKDKAALLETAGITPFLISLTPELSGDDIRDFLRSEVLIINIPPGRRKENVREFHVAQIRNLIAHIERSPVQFVVYVSSTSVYPDTDGVVVEEDAGHPKRPSGRALLEVEQLLMTHAHFESTVLRFGGLYGPGRPLGRFLAGKKNLDNGEARVNLIHQEDCINIILEIISQNIRGEIFNACADQHPRRREMYPAAAARLGLQPPHFTEDGGKAGKTVNSDKLKDKLGYRFKHQPG
ncbi:MAG: SDR family oxidoreductase [Balneolales bacterium]